jgi:FkbM family methyltransferase
MPRGALNVEFLNHFVVRQKWKSPSDHPVFKVVKPYEGVAPIGDIDFAGVLERFNPLKVPDNSIPSQFEFIRASMVDLDEEIFEWIDIIDSVLKASDSFVFVELGAGYGRWSARAAKLAESQGFKPEKITLITVEAEPRHAEWIRQHFEINRIESTHWQFDCAVSNFSGEKDFYVKRAEDENPTNAARVWYGQSLVNHEIGGYQKEKVVVKRLEEIINSINGIDIIDLIDLDLQGEDSKVLLDSQTLLAQRVKKVHIGTDSVEEETIIRSFFQSMDWDCVWDYQTTGIRKTGFGKIRFVDGVQTWTNPALYR